MLKAAGVKAGIVPVQRSGEREKTRIVIRITLSIVLFWGQTASSLLFELPRTGGEETKKDVVSLAFFRKLHGCCFFSVKGPLGA